MAKKTPSRSQASRSDRCSGLMPRYRLPDIITTAQFTVPPARTAVSSRLVRENACARAAHRDTGCVSEHRPARNVVIQRYPSPPWLTSRLGLPEVRFGGRTVWRCFSKGIGGESAWTVAVIRTRRPGSALALRALRTVGRRPGRFVLSGTQPSEFYSPFDQQTGRESVPNRCCQTMSMPRHGTCGPRAGCGLQLVRP